MNSSRHHRYSRLYIIARARHPIEPLSSIRKQSLKSAILLTSPVRAVDVTVSDLDLIRVPHHSLHVFFARPESDASVCHVTASRSFTGIVTVTTHATQAPVLLTALIYANRCCATTVVFRRTARGTDGRGFTSEGCVPCPRG